jgi:hypothetical protein
MNATNLLSHSCPHQKRELLPAVQIEHDKLSLPLFIVR